MTSTDLPRMQQQPRSRAQLERGRAGASEAADKAPTKAKAPMMRQYELVERVRKYNPHTDEELLKGLNALAPPEEKPEPVEPDDEE